MQLITSALLNTQHEASVKNTINVCKIHSYRGMLARYTTDLCGAFKPITWKIMGLMSTIFAVRIP